jgi:hypothetical protein
MKEMKKFSFVFLAVLALLAGACKRPTPEIPPTPVTLSLDNLNRIPPPDVLEEVYFFSGGAGGGEGCELEENYPSPTLGSAPDTAEKMQLIEIVTCGWSPDEKIEIFASHPDGTIVKQELETDSHGELWFQYVVVWEEKAGIYVFSFRSQGTKLEHHVKVTDPVGPHLYLSEDKLYFYQFSSSERVRLFLYDSSRDKLIGWNELKTSNEGNLVVNIPANVDYSVQYVAVGDNSGQVLFLYQGWVDDLAEQKGWDTGDIYCKGASLQDPKFKGFHSVQVIAPEITGYVADDDDNPDWSVKVTLKQGALINIWPGGPICKNNMFWWQGVTDLYPDAIIWIPEGAGGQYYFKVID